MKRLRRAADLRRDRHNRRPLRGVIAPVLDHHPHGPLAHFRRKLRVFAACPWLHSLKSWSLRQTRGGSLHVDVNGSILDLSDTDQTAGTNPGTIATLLFLTNGAGDATVFFNQTTPSGSEASPIIDNVTVSEYLRFQPPSRCSPPASAHSVCLAGAGNGRTPLHAQPPDQNT